MQLDEAKEILEKSGYKLDKDTISKGIIKAVSTMKKMIGNAGWRIKNSNQGPQRAGFYVYDDDDKCICHIIYNTNNNSFDLYFAPDDLDYLLGMRKFDDKYSDVIKFINKVADTCFDYFDAR